MGENMIEDWVAVLSHLTCGPLSCSEILGEQWINGHVDYSMSRSSWHQLVPIEFKSSPVARETYYRTELAHWLQERFKQYLLSIPQTIRKHMKFGHFKVPFGEQKGNLMTSAGVIQSQ